MRWLAIVGIGENGTDGLGARARALIAGAALVFGGERHLGLAASLIRGEARRWSSPLDASLAEIDAARGRPICVLASGDPFHFGIGATLATLVPADEMDVVPAPGAFSLAAARLGWPLQDVAMLSLHGRPVELILPHLQPGRRILALTSDAAAPAEIAALLAANGFGPSHVSVLEALSGPRERIRTARAEAFELDAIDPLNLLAVEVVATLGARILARAAGLPDALYEHDGQLTKREVRAITLAALGPTRGQLLWDIGAGAGSIGIEWMLADPAMRAVAIESDPARADRIRRNALAFGVPGLAVVEGMAPAALPDLPRPDAVFVGGGGTEAGVLDAAIAALKPGGTLVVNAVSTQLEAMLIERHGRDGGTLTRIAIAHAEPIGGLTGWRPAMPVTQWTWTKP